MALSAREAQKKTGLHFCVRFVARKQFETVASQLTRSFTDMTLFDFLRCLRSLIWTNASNSVCGIVRVLISTKYQAWNVPSFRGTFYHGFWIGVLTTHTVSGRDENESKESTCDFQSNGKCLWWGERRDRTSWLERVIMESIVESVRAPHHETLYKHSACSVRKIENRSEELTASVISV